MSLEMPLQAEPQQQQADESASPSLSEAFHERNLGTGAEDKEVAEVRTALEQEAGEDGEDHRGASTTLDEEEARSFETAKSAEWQKANTEALVELLGVDEDADFKIPRALAHFKASDIAATMEKMGLEAVDLEDPYYADLLANRLNSFADEAEGDAEEKPETEEDPDKVEEPKTEEEKTAAEAAEKLARDQAVQTKALTDLTPDEIQSLNTHMVALDARAKEVTTPLMSDVFVKGLAGILGTPADQVPVLRGVMDALNTAGVGMIESAVPRIMNEWIGANFGAILQNYAPGLAESYRSATIENTWHACLEQDEFKDLGLPRFGTPEFQEAADRVHLQNSWLASFDPTDPKTGQPLPILEALQVKAAVTARLLAGERISPKQLLAKTAEAIAQGKRSAEKSTRRVSAGRALKGGRSTGVIGGVSERSELFDAFHRGGGGNDGIA
jgi:hypothetical protein